MHSTKLECVKYKMSSMLKPAVLALEKKQKKPVYYSIYIRIYYIYIYRIAGNFRGVLIFVIFVTIPRVTKFSTHEIFHPRIFSRLLHIELRESRNLKSRKLILKTRDSFSRKFAPPKITRYTVYIYMCAYYNIP